MSPGNCRFCLGTGDALVPYGARALAHGHCLIEHKGWEFVLTLPPGVLGRLQIFDLTADQVTEDRDVLDGVITARVAALLGRLRAQS